MTGRAVAIRVGGRHGWALLHRGFLIGAHHVVDSCGRRVSIAIRRGPVWTRVFAECVRTAPESDLEVLRLGGRALGIEGRPAIRLTRPPRPRRLRDYRYRTLEGRLVSPRGGVRVFQLAAAIAPGSSGFPVMAGSRLVGLVHGIALASGRPTAIMCGLAARVLLRNLFDRPRPAKARDQRSTAPLRRLAKSPGNPEISKAV